MDKNEILIAIKANSILEKTEPLILTELPLENDEICPNFIHIHFIEQGGSQISIIGTRLLDKTSYEKQLKPLRRYLKSLQSKNQNLKIISIGDQYHGGFIKR